MSDTRTRRRTQARDALDPITIPASTSTSRAGAHIQAVSKAIFAPFRRKNGDSAKLLSDCALLFLVFFYHSRNLKNIFNFFYGGANSGSNTDDTKDDQ